MKAKRARKKLKIKPYFVSEGEWRRKERRGNLEGCCDCGLIHRVDYTVRNGVVYKRVALAPRLTNLARKMRNITVTHE